MRSLVVSALVMAALVPFVPAAASTSHTVTASDFQWSPSSLTIAPGDVVEFVLGGGTHAWERTDGSDACELPCTRTFAEEGVFAYVCSFHASMRGEIRVGAPPTVAIASPQEGEVVGGLLRVAGVSTNAASVTVRLGVSAEHAATLAPDGTWAVDVPTGAAPNGAVSLRARAVSAAGIAAEHVIAVEVENAPFVDLGVLSLAADQDATLTNTLVFRVKNEGNVPAAPVLVRAEYLHDGAWRFIGERTFTTLAAGATVQGSIAWTPDHAHLGRFDVRVVADPEGALADADASDDVREASAAWVSAAIPGIVAPVP